MIMKNNTFKPVWNLPRVFHNFINNVLSTSSFPSDNSGEDSSGRRMTVELTCHNGTQMTNEVDNLRLKAEVRCLGHW